MDRRQFLAASALVPLAYIPTIKSIPIKKKGSLKTGFPTFDRWINEYGNGFNPGTILVFEGKENSGRDLIIKKIIEFNSDKEFSEIYDQHHGIISCHRNNINEDYNLDYIIKLTTINSIKYKNVFNIIAELTKNRYGSIPNEKCLISFNPYRGIYEYSRIAKGKVSKS